jgi:hypothetical protein
MLVMQAFFLLCREMQLTYSFAILVMDVCGGVLKVARRRGAV